MCKHLMIPINCDNLQVIVLYVEWAKNSSPGAFTVMIHTTVAFGNHLLCYLSKQYNYETVLLTLKWNKERRRHAHILTETFTTPTVHGRDWPGAKDFTTYQWKRRLTATRETSCHCTWWMWQQSIWPGFPRGRQCSPLSSTTSPTPAADTETETEHVYLVFKNPNPEECKKLRLSHEKWFFVPGCWRQTGGSSGWGERMTGSRQCPSHHLSLCCTRLRKG